ncbi:MAG: DNA-directed RNA polymerase [Thermoplasmata archaeon]
MPSGQRRGESMYKIVRREDTVRIPPDRLGEDMDKVIQELARSNFEGKFERGELTVIATNISPVGVGRIIHGDGAVYQKVVYDALVFRPEVQEVVLGQVCEVMKFGAFIHIGPLDGLLHISQIMDDRVEVNEASNRLVGKDTKRELKVGDLVRARIVTMSINERTPRESKIGLTMRQPGLGKLEWLTEEKKEEKKKGEKKKEKGVKSK